MTKLFSGDRVAAYLKRIFGSPNIVGKLPEGWGLAAFGSLPIGAIPVSTQMTLAAAPPIVRSKLRQPDSGWACVTHEAMVMVVDHLTPGLAPIEGDQAIIRTSCGLVIAGSRQSEAFVSLADGFTFGALADRMTTNVLVDSFGSSSRYVKTLPCPILVTNDGQDTDQREIRIDCRNVTIPAGVTPLGNTLIRATDFYLFLKGFWTAAEDLQGSDYEDPQANFERYADGYLGPYRRSFHYLMSK